MTLTQTEERFGAFGGRYVPETLIPALDELTVAFERALADPSFRRDLDEMLSTYVGRPSPLSSAERLSEAVGVSVYLKREDLNHTGAHKINNTVGQALLARLLRQRGVDCRRRSRRHTLRQAAMRWSRRRVW